MTEIGGYFGLEQSHGTHEYYSGLNAFNTAANALICLCRARHIRKLFLPYYLCDSVSAACGREHIPVSYYHINENMRPVIERSPEEDEYLYLVNYYGQLTDQEILGYAERFGRIILDNVQAFFQRPIKGIDTLYSCRKYFGVPDGAYLSSGISVDGIATDDSDARLGHIIGRVRDSASAHYREFRANEALLRSLPPMLMSNRTHAMLTDIDYDAVRQKREENFAYLDAHLGKLNRLRLRCPEGPYAYPLYLENGEEIRRKLIEKNIYVATLWPNVTDGPEALTARSILPLPCDQRYDKENMQFIIKEVFDSVKN